MLLDDLDTLGKRIRNAITRPDNRDNPLRTRLPSRIDDPLDKGPSRHLMKHLGNIGPHPSALASGHDEDRKRRGHGLGRVPSQPMCERSSLSCL